MELLARHCYVRLGAMVKTGAVQELLPSCIPSKLYRTKSPEKWASIVMAAHTKVSCGRLGTLALSLPLRQFERGWSLPP